MINTRKVFLDVVFPFLTKICMVTFSKYYSLAQLLCAIVEQSSDLTSELIINSLNVCIFNIPKYLSDCVSGFSAIMKNPYKPKKDIITCLRVNKSKFLAFIFFFRR